MLHYPIGNLLESPAEALVNTVNTVGVMGKGIALQFKEAFPSNFKAYAAACKAGELKPGGLLPVWDENLTIGRKLIINFATKEHWKGKSKYSYIETGLQELVPLLLTYGIKSVALPPLGCGNGGLEWSRVKALIEQHLANLPIEVRVYEPNADIKKVLQKENQTTVKLTPARAMLLDLLFYYESVGEYTSLFAANKLAYFLQRNGVDLRLKYTPRHYGPYSVGVENVLYRLNGTYILGLEQKSAKVFEQLFLIYDKKDEIDLFIKNSLSKSDQSILESVKHFIDGFESSFSLELLSSVDWIIQQEPNISLDDIESRIQEWNNRKGDMFKSDYIRIAHDHLVNHSKRNLLSN